MTIDISQDHQLPSHQLSGRASVAPEWRGHIVDGVDAPRVYVNPEPFNSRHIFSPEDLKEGRPPTMSANLQDAMRALNGCHRTVDEMTGETMATCTPGLDDLGAVEIAVKIALSTAELGGRLRAIANRAGQL